MTLKKKFLIITSYYFSFTENYNKQIVLTVFEVLYNNDQSQIEKS